MTDGYRIKLDSREWDKAFSALEGPVRESLARRMLVSGGVLLRDAAKSNARMPANKEGVELRGVWADSMYLARDEEAENKTTFAYKVSWNATKAPHGHLLEFGHWMTHKVYKASNGEWYTLKDHPLATPEWVAARPALRPTFDSYGNVAVRVMIQRGQKELPILLKEHTQS
jgi:hypothetical protein